MALMVYNTLTKRKEEFVPLIPGHVGIYVCGPTVYNHAHIGHAKSYVSFDVIVRYLRYLGYKVLYVQNITDVGHLTDDADRGEDKIERQSRIAKVQPMEIAEMYTRSYFEDMDALGVVRPNISPRASGHVLEQIELVRQLLEKGFAYEVNGSVYFDVRKFPEYGKLSGRRIEELVAGARVEVSEEKRYPADFALWKRAEPGHILRWKSPWGEGYPGWHVECSVMSTKYLGQPFDIHGGGIENQFPHHECEIAQSEAAAGKPFARYWLHNNMVTVNGVKMGKSLGNFVTLKEAFQKYNPVDIRFLILMSHYRSPLDYSDEAVESASRGLSKLHATIKTLQTEIQKAMQEPRSAIAPLNIDAYRARFIDAMNDDFNTPQAIAVLFDLSKEVNQLLNSEVQYTANSLQEIDQLFRDLGGKVLGIVPETYRPVAPQKPPSIEDDLIQLLIDIRNELRAQKLWGLADQIRNKLSSLGIILEDKKEETTFRRTKQP
ncbi:MAG: cysteine--tRNA ligase [Bacteroidota bacterium]